MFFASNYFYAYQGAVNALMFDGPTRALNGALEGAGGIIGALLIGFLVLDGKHLKRRTRGYLGLGVVATMTIIVWGVALSWQVTFNRADAKALKDSATLINYKHANYRGKGALYFFCTSFVFCFTRPRVFSIILPPFRSSIFPFPFYLYVSSFI